jgi:hypothetical protein
LNQAGKKKAARSDVVSRQPEDLLFDHIFEDFHRLHKAAVSHGDHHIDWIEVSLQSKHLAKFVL